MTIIRRRPASEGAGFEAASQFRGDSMMTDTLTHVPRHAAIDIANAFVAAWSGRDVDACLALLDPEATYSDNASGNGADGSGLVCGHDDIRAVIARPPARHLEQLAMRTAPVRESAFDADELHCRLEFALRHRTSGDILFCHSRLVLRIRNHRIQAVKVHHDTAMRDAFLHLNNTTPSIEAVP